MNKTIRYQVNRNLIFMKEKYLYYHREKFLSIRNPWAGGLILQLGERCEGPFSIADIVKLKIQGAKSRPFIKKLIQQLIEMDFIKEVAND